jgi:crotonobetainyl-CoA:carnitine CoA-transferase CaiB-like acyl-CoA transferase
MPISDVTKVAIGGVSVCLLGAYVSQTTTPDGGVPPLVVLASSVGGMIATLTIQLAVQHIVDKGEVSIQTVPLEVSVKSNAAANLLGKISRHF